MSHEKRINNPNDLIEEAKAANRIISHLSGTPIINTSGDDNHQIKPLSIQIKVGLSEVGDTVFVNIAQQDRHHPSLVYRTIIDKLKEMPEFQDLTIKPIHPDTAYNADTGVITIAFDLPAGGADHLIHELAEGKKQVTQPSYNNSWVNKLLYQLLTPQTETSIGK